MEYLLAFQFLCGGFAAYVAARKRRSLLGWFAIGFLLPVLGAVLCLVVGARVRAGGPGPEPRKRRRPKRCNGSYIPDCQGCPHFTKPLFDSSYNEKRRGRCEFFDRELQQEGRKRGSRVVIEQ